ncbi:MAG: hypothetical protein IKI94_05310 [Ruminococcus sp.]|nr:hypothetical protein [Ruminococcus sp.]
MMNIFEAVREKIPVRAAAEYYGLKVRGGMTNCIFHNDRTPSMRLYDDHFYCFGCGKCGDVTKLVEGLFGESPIQSAKRLCADFGIEHIRGSPPKVKTKYVSTQTQEQRAFRILSDYCNLLRRYRTEYAPKSDDEDLHLLFTEGLTKLSEYEYYCEIFITGTKEEQQKFIEERRNLLGELERKLKLDQSRSAQDGQVCSA